MIKIYFTTFCDALQISIQNSKFNSVENFQKLIDFLHRFHGQYLYVVLVKLNAEMRDRQIEKDRNTDREKERKND